jgi:hypothetical protein
VLRGASAAVPGAFGGAVRESRASVGAAVLRCARVRRVPCAGGGRQETRRRRGQIHQEGGEADDCAGRWVAPLKLGKKCGGEYLHFESKPSDVCELTATFGSHAAHAAIPAQASNEPDEGAQTELAVLIAEHDATKNKLEREFNANLDRETLRASRQVADAIGRLELNHEQNQARMQVSVFVVPPGVSTRLGDSCGRLPAI